MYLSTFTGNDFFNIELVMALIGVAVFVFLIVSIAKSRLFIPAVIICVIFGTTVVSYEIIKNKAIKSYAFSSPGYLGFSFGEFHFVNERNGLTARLYHKCKNLVLKDCLKQLETRVDKVFKSDLRP